MPRGRSHDAKHDGARHGNGHEVGAVAACLMIGLAVVSPVILGGSRLGAIDLLVLAAIVLGAGLVLRWQGAGSTRTLGSVLAILGVAFVVLVAGLIWLLTQSLGRPY
jgi:hypothetical protein